MDYWDQFYSSDEYKFLESPAEIGRFGVIAELICQLPGRLKILDIGCGLGHLCGLIPENRIELYLGIDISQEAIAKAQRNYSRHTFLSSNIEGFTSDTLQDVVVISCVLEELYNADYERVIDKALALVSTGGLLIISIYNRPPANEIIAYLQERTHIQKHIEIISHDSSLRWHVLTIPKS
jgi:2-polyprenyl-3-methyl-5-hydroxy-6-metoxy-1,4-benzoquinol methylase